MTPRERVLAALDFRAPDMVPLEYHPSPGGLYEHGDALRALWRRFPGDFGDASTFPYAPPASADFDADGRYHAFRTDAWGTEWEYRIFGVWGHPVRRPLDDLSRLDGFRAPPVPPTKGAEFEGARRLAAEHRARYFRAGGGVSIFETLHSLRGFEDVLVDIALDTPQINRLADLVTDHQVAMLRYRLALGADSISIGDDFGTSSGLMLSLDQWRRFFAPRYARLIAVARAAGVRVHFHCCGMVLDLLPEFRKLGADSVWLQQSLYDPGELAAACRGLHLASALHFRGELMIQGTPERIRRTVRETAEAFRVREGGAWFYVEIDPGFPRENMEALFEAVGEFRGAGPGAR